MTDHVFVADAAARPHALPVRVIGPADLTDALKAGFADFWAIPTQLMFLCVIYPIVGLVLARAAFGYALLPLLYPLASGFALIGPFAALGLYELSRRRERGLPVSFLNTFDVFRSPSFYSIAAVGLLLLAIFIAWLGVAQMLYQSIFGADAPQSVDGFLHLVTGTQAGLKLFLVGGAVGFVFAAIVLTLTVVTFPLLLDRKVGPVVAILTSIRAVLANPAMMAAWGLIVGVSLLLGSLPFFIGLAFVLPILGHATWHLYRKVVIAP